MLPACGGDCIHFANAITMLAKTMNREHKEKREMGTVPLLRTVLFFVLLIGFATVGCKHDPFYGCDNRRSLADWFDEYGPLGCSCNHGNCGCQR
jgi:hypothetical protein